MQLANVTWDDLIMYLEALIREPHPLEEVDGKEGDVLPDRRRVLAARPLPEI
jgi:hypothetical protein